MTHFKESDCIFECGKKIYWDPTIKDSESKIKWREVDSGVLHNYPRCAELLKVQGKTLDKGKKKK